MHFAKKQRAFSSFNKNNNVFIDVASKQSGSQSAWKSIVEIKMMERKKKKKTFNDKAPSCKVDVREKWNLNHE